MAVDPGYAAEVLAGMIRAGGRWQMTNRSAYELRHAAVRPVGERSWGPPLKVTRVEEGT